MSVLLLIFRKGISTTAIEKLLSGFRGGLEWAPMFTENPRVYAMRVPGDQAQAWKDIMAQLPEVELAERIGSVRLVPDRAA